MNVNHVHFSNAIPHRAAGPRLSSLLSDDTHIIILDPMLPLRPLGPLGGGEGRGEMGDSRALVGTRLTLPAAAAVGPLPLRPGGRGGHVCTEQRNPA